MRVRSRSIMSPALNGGKKCPASSTQVQYQRCAVDCVLSSWKDWTSCSTTREKSRSRRVITAPRNGGLPCSDLEEYNTCGKDSADVQKTCNSEYGTWKPFSGCMTSFGYKSRSRTHANASKSKVQLASCSLTERILCVVSCVLSKWSSWGKCNTVLNNHLRTRSVLIKPLNGGTPCGLLIQQAVCVLDCRLGEWSAWSECQLTTGRKSRTRSVLVKPLNSGKRCDALEGTERCTIDCVMSKWAEFGPCKSLTGLKMRERRVLHAPINNGGKCGDLTQYKDCVAGCVAGKWSPFSRCIVTGAKAGTR